MSFEIPIPEAIEEALAPETFSVLDFVKRANTPTKTIRVYTDADAALKITDLKIKRAEDGKNKKTKKVESLSITEGTDYDYEIDELQERLEESAVEFVLRGLAPKAVDALDKHLKATNDYKDGEENEAYTRALNDSLVAKSIVSATVPGQAPDTHSWTPEEVRALTEELYVVEANKLYIGAGEVNYVSKAFEVAVSADF